MHAASIYPKGNQTEFIYQLAAFLVFAEEYSYFCVGPNNVWLPDSMIWHEEYEYSLGAPLGKAQPHLELQVYQQLDNLFSEVQAGHNSSTVRLIGKFDDFQPCADLCDTSASCESFQYTQNQARRGAWAGLCYHRSDRTWAPVASAAAVSGLKFSWWSRRFAHASVEIDVISTAARIEWS